jgi:hypothetical protein
MVSLEFFIGIILSALVDSASNRNEYKEYFLRGKRGRCVGRTGRVRNLAVRNLGASTSWNPVGLLRPIMGVLYLYLV